MKVFWSGQSDSDVPPENDWLSVSELARLDNLRFPKRRRDWRLGRWTAKCAVASYLHLATDRPSLADIEIIPAASGAPEVRIADKPEQVTISLSHRDGRAACAVAQSGVRLGCDIETIEPHSDAFIQDYFTREEQRLIAHAFPSDRPHLVTLVWSAKESALKALREGLRLDTRKVEVTPEASLADNGWSELRVSCPGGQVFYGWWQQAGSLLQTIVTAPPSAPPILLGISSSFSSHRSTFSA